MIPSKFQELLERDILPPWLFDYPVKTFYARQEKAISDLRELTPSEFPDWDDIQLLKVNPFPLCLAAKN